MAIEHSTLTELFTDIADAIRFKTGYTGKLKADGFPVYIDAIAVPESITYTITNGGLNATGSGSNNTTITVPLDTTFYVYINGQARAIKAVPNY